MSSIDYLTFGISLYTEKIQPDKFILQLCPAKCSSQIEGYSNVGNVSTAENVKC